MKLARIIFAALLLAACKPSKGGAVTWTVYDKSGKAVAELKDAPGPIVSRAGPPPDGKVVTHPFVTASSLDAMAENDLHEALQAAASFKDFVARLRKAGFSVKEGKAP
jgi:hypothetical protein